MTDIYTRNLNPAQLEAVTSENGPVLVIAGAGSGKTRTIVYRLSRLADTGVSPESILLLTFTRKAAQEMLNRAATLRGGAALMGVTGGTFHSFAYQILRRFPLAMGPSPRLTVMDRADSEGVMREARDRTKIGKGDRSFPRRRTILELYSKSRNKESTVEDILKNEAFHLLKYGEDVTALAREYEILKAEHGLLDYDDLLFELERTLREHGPARDYVHARYAHLMVDEFQDTNLVQARLVRLLAGEEPNVMAVGDDAQSIYAFRGADVRNILSFPDMFPGTRIIRLEQNYRSTQPILDMTNGLLAQARPQFRKQLFSDRKEGPRPQVIRTMSDRSQAGAVTAKIAELSRTYPLHEIAVLFRAGYQSFPVEVALNKLGIKFQKFGGIKFTEAAHVKDALAYLRLAANPADLPAWGRMLEHVKGVGPKTCAKIQSHILTGDAKALTKACAKKPEIREQLDFLDRLRNMTQEPGPMLEAVLVHYQPILEKKYPDDYPRRQAGLEQLARIAASYADRDAFLADISLEIPEDESSQDRENVLVLSTVHSAKGLEWSAVLIIDLVEDRFPSRHALARAEDLEEERRLMYVACTRARDRLYLFVPSAVYNQRAQTSEPTSASPFISELPRDSYQELRETFSGGLTAMDGQPPGMARPRPQSSTRPGAAADCDPKDGPGGSTTSQNGRPHPSTLGYCHHKIFGRGKIVSAPSPDRYKVNFPGFGLKVILADYLTME